MEVGGIEPPSEYNVKLSSTCVAPAYLSRIRSCRGADHFGHQPLYLNDPSRHQIIESPLATPYPEHGDKHSSTTGLQLTVKLGGHGVVIFAICGLPSLITGTQTTPARQQLPATPVETCHPHIVRDKFKNVRESHGRLSSFQRTDAVCTGPLRAYRAINVHQSTPTIHGGVR